MKTLKEKTAIVTGASSGIGRGIAEVLAREGCRLLITCRNNLDGLNDTVRECRRLGATVETLQADIARMRDIDRIAETASARLGRVDVLVNNAGITPKYPFLEITEAEFDELFRINCKGTYFCAQRIAGIMVEQQRGKIINISSLTARGASEHFSAYSATKSAINKYTEIMALELAPYNIQVNAIAAGWIPTRNEEAAMSEEKRKRCMYHVPLGRFGAPRDIGELVAFLADDRSDYITGQTLYADGGQSILLSLPSRVRDGNAADGRSGS